ncbi:ArnT family glycosyltransferase [Dokdonella sp. MW10]|uniref:ArnT family glycosyltransferase n=1 Tax=Dokdonella sp. MW10 TaxID=2992926 RepID=UPI003F810052
MPVHAWRDGAIAWRRAFIVAFLACTALKLWIAASLSPFVDEAFYWQESRRLAWSYSDVPGMTAWLIHLGESVLGHSVFAMRLPFLVLATATVVLVVVLARRLAGACAGWQAGLGALVLPLLGSLGVLALPDVPLLFASVLALVALERALATRSTGAWCLVGVSLALAWLSHYRAAMLVAAGFAIMVATARGRSCWRERGFWIAVAIGALGILPLLAFNATQGWSAAGFQFVDRHPWSFQAEALLQPFEQALVTTPLLYMVFVGTLVAALRRLRLGAPWDLLAWSACVPILGYFVLGLFADHERFRVHWPLAGYVPLLVALPLLLREAWRGRALRMTILAAFMLAAAGTLVVLGWFAAAAHPASTAYLAAGKLYPSHFAGWRETASAARDLMASAEHAGKPLVADNFMLAAELEFALQAGAVPTLDSPLNAKHGRARQLAIWQQDEAGVRALAGRDVVVAMDETALRERDRAAWRDAVCARFDALQEIRRLDLHGGRKRIVFLEGVVRAEPVAGGRCEASGQGETR